MKFLTKEEKDLRKIEVGHRVMTEETAEVILSKQGSFTDLLACRMDDSR